MRKMLGMAVTAGALVAGLGAAAPATAAESPNTPGPTHYCQGGFQVIDHHNVPGATIYLLHQGARHIYCVVTIKTAHVGQRTPVAAAVRTVDGRWAIDAGRYPDHAGPVAVFPGHKCIIWGGGTHDPLWQSKPGHCGG